MRNEELLGIMLAAELGFLVGTIRAYRKSNKNFEKAIQEFNETNDDLELSVESKWTWSIKNIFG